ncbi:Putative two-component sensor [hydrothermal vent metagenome]|uniref:histidine kinase n=1 Tax=hydrothermal vent metagenome TaxID=652676 RepID=A0A3B0XBX6_9ZZZZ
MRKYLNKILQKIIPTSSDEIKIQAELINNLYGQWRGILIGVITTSTGIAFLFNNKVADERVFTWLFAVYVLFFFRHLSVARFKKHKHTAEQTIKWGWVFAFFAFLSGVIWGVASVLFFTAENIQLYNVLTLIIIVMSVGSLAGLSAYPFAYYVFVVPAMLPMAWQYMNIDDQNYHIFGVLLMVFLFALFSFSRVNYKMLRQSVELRFKNTDLIEQLTEQKEVAEKANIAKTKFLAAASHDLRQPLHAIGLFLGALIEKVERRDQKNIVEKIQKSSNALNDLLDSLLDVSKLDAGVIKVDSQIFSINDLFDSLKNEFESCAVEKNIRLKFVKTQLCVNTDLRILDRIIRNLISNAIRYTRNGGVVIGCRRVNEQILLAVYDTGLGIEKNKIEKVFQEFYQLNNPERDRSKGLGLGLAIVKRMTDLLDFSLSVISKPNQGSMFGIVIPEKLISKQPRSPEEPAVAPVFFDNKTILIIDDEEEVRESLTQLLLSWHCSVIAAASGDEAVNVLKQKAQLMPDMILADYRLRNNETGNDAIVKVQLMFPDNVIPALIITGDTAPDKIKEANTGGYEIIHKPVSPNTLRSVIEEMLNN